MTTPVNYSLYLIVDDAWCSPTAMPHLVSQIIDNGVTCIQLRMKHSANELITTIANQVLEITRPKCIPLILNDEIEIVKKIPVDGVHIGQKDGNYFAARDYLGHKKLIGLSIENREQALQYAHCGADYFGVGPVFLTQSKRDAASPLGMEELRVITHLLAQPVVAIGGMQQENILSVLQTGVAGIAFISAILSSSCPSEEVKKIAKIISSYREKNEK